MDKIKMLLYLFVFTNLIHCQEMNKTPEFHVEISHPANKYEIEFVSDHIKTLEGSHAGLPYGGTSGDWGQSGKRWTEQHGTPIGADITYYAGYEDTFYHLDADFPVEKIKDYMERAYANGEALPEFHKEPLQKYKRSGRYEEFAYPINPYNSFSDLVFGFAPKGMVVVWLRFGAGVQIELGRYQAEVIKDDIELEKKLFASWSMNRREVKERDFIPNASPQDWDNYRARYNYAAVFTSENRGLRLFRMWMDFFNGEEEVFYRPWINEASYEKRAIPKELNFTWETGKDQQYTGYAYFNWEKTNGVFKKVGNQAKLEFKIASDNSSFEVLLDNHPVPTDSIRVFKTNDKFNDSYK
ncbi:DUF2931 family protein [Chryseobacterium taichungense]|uniref:DUF2931 family protein n=1 Tax=Chryseobacterium taichungense TaxID=295069 RepID=UPI0028A72752|nr:DUF2931 family protein [Chryseobacterium taichungense]